MIGPPSVERKRVHRGKVKRIFASALINRTVLVVALRFTTAFVKLVQLLVGGE
jgi:hypothetical protein